MDDYERRAAADGNTLTRRSRNPEAVRHFP
jgi:hypothetical protein